MVSTQTVHLPPCYYRESFTRTSLILFECVHGPEPVTWITPIAWHSHIFSTPLPSICSPLLIFLRVRLSLTVSRDIKVSVFKASPRRQVGLQALRSLLHKTAQQHADDGFSLAPMTRWPYSYINLYTRLVQQHSILLSKTQLNAKPSQDKHFQFTPHIHGTVMSFVPSQLQLLQFPIPYFYGFSQGSITKTGAWTAKQNAGALLNPHFQLQTTVS